MFDFEPIPASTRKLMLAEFEFDVANKKLYFNPFLKPEAKTIYFQSLLAALTDGTPESLAETIAVNDLLVEKHTYTKQGKQIEAHVAKPFDTTLAAGEFNRYYMRAICLLAIDQGLDAVEVYRAKAVKIARQEIDERIGRRIDPQILLDDLRQTNFEDESSYGLGAPNSGLSVRIPEKN